MEKRRLGKTNLEVTVLSMGGIPLQRLNQDQSTEVIKQCVKLGINFIDTARGYTVSEGYIGNALETLGLRDKVYLATKSMARDYEGMKEEIEISLRDLKTDVIELYQLHNVRTQDQYDQIMSEKGAYRALLEAKAAGKILNIGITGHSADLLEKVLDPKLFDTVQFPYNPVEQQGEKLFQMAADYDIGTIVMKPIAGGAFQEGELAIKWIMENPNVSVLIPGMDNIDQVASNIQASKEKLTDEQRLEVEKIGRELGTEFCRRCGYCAPCPQNIDIPLMFLFEGYLKRYGLVEWSRERYGAIEHTASQCIKCGICERRCPYDLPIITMMESVSKTFGR